MRRDVASGTLLIVGAAAGLVVMGLLPTAHGLMDPESGAHLTRVNVMVHGLALAAVPAGFLGLLGLRHRDARAIRLDDLDRHLALSRGRGGRPLGVALDETRKEAPGPAHVIAIILPERLAHHPLLAGRANDVEQQEHRESGPSGEPV